MSTVTAAVATCPALQSNLNESFKACAEIAPDPISITPFLMSDINRTNLRFLVSPSSFKKREVQVVYEQMINDSEIDTKNGCDKTCTATTERGDLSQIYEISCGGTIGESLIDPANWIDSCTDTAGFAMREILRLIAASDNKNSKAIVSDVGGLMGAWASDVQGVTGNALVINTLIASTANINPVAWYDVDFAVRATHCGSTFIGSGQTFLKYARLMEAGCCAQQGLDLSEIMMAYGHAVDYDTHFNQTFGADMAVALQVGAVQILSLNHNGGSLATMDQFNVAGGQNIYAEYIVNSPWTGIPYDVTVKYDCGKVHLIVESNVQAVEMPLDMFPVDHRLEGVTYVNMIDVTNT